MYSPQGRGSYRECYQVIKIVVIIGPTGTGKTEISVPLAQKFNGEIINADSRQIYRELIIGTSIPSDNFFKTVPHHLFGVSQVDDSWDAARFQEEADRIIAEVSNRGHLPIIVGGTGLYVKSLIYGLFLGPAANPKVRVQLEARIQKEGLWALHDELKKVDPEAAAEIHPNDPTRIIRALEVYQVTGKPISEHQKAHQFQKARYEFLKIGLRVDRDLLCMRLDKRVDEMVAEGLENEVRDLKEKYGENSLLLRAIGYKEWFPYFKGESKKEEVLEKIKAATRQFAKRQMTWFKKEKDILWFEAGDLDGMTRAVEKYLAKRDSRES